MTTYEGRRSRVSCKQQDRVTHNKQHTCSYYIIRERGRKVIELPHQKSIPNTIDDSYKKSTPNHFYYSAISSILEE